MTYMVPCNNGCGNAVPVVPGEFRTTPAAVVVVDGKAQSVGFCSNRCAGEFLGHLDSGHPGGTEGDA